MYLVEAVEQVDGVLAPHTVVTQTPMCANFVSCKGHSSRVGNSIVLIPPLKKGVRGISQQNDWEPDHVIPASKERVRGIHPKNNPPCPPFVKGGNAPSGMRLPLS